MSFRAEVERKKLEKERLRQEHEFEMSRLDVDIRDLELEQELFMSVKSQPAFEEEEAELPPPPSDWLVDFRDQDHEGGYRYKSPIRVEFNDFDDRGANSKPSDLDSPNPPSISYYPPSHGPHPTRHQSAPQPGHHGYALDQASHGRGQIPQRSVSHHGHYDQLSDLSTHGRHPTMTIHQPTSHHHDFPDYTLSASHHHDRLSPWKPENVKLEKEFHPTMHQSPQHRDFPDYTRSASHHHDYPDYTSHDPGPTYRPSPWKSENVNVEKDFFSAQTRALLAMTEGMSLQANTTALLTNRPSEFSGRDILEYPLWRHQFVSTVWNKFPNAHERLHYMGQFTSGLAKESIRAYLMCSTDQACYAALATLDKRFGDHFTIAQERKSRLEKWEDISYQDSDGFQKLSDFMDACLTAMSDNTYLQSLDDADFNQKLIQKTKWGERAHRFRKQNGAFPPFSVFCEFIRERVDIAVDPVTGWKAQRKTDGGRARKTLATMGSETETNPSSSSSLKIHNTQDIYPSKRKTIQVHCKFCGFGHETKHCFKLGLCPSSAIVTFLRSNKLCSTCGELWSREHKCQAMTCRTCKAETNSHITIFHVDDNNNKETPDVKVQDQDPSKVLYSSSKKISTSESGRNAKEMKVDWSHIVQVKVYPEEEPEKSIKMVYSCMDSESNTSWATESLVKDWITPDDEEEMFLRTIDSGSKSVEPKSFSVVKGLVMESMDGKAKCRLPKLFITDEIPADHQNIPTPEEVKNIPHLQHVADEFPVVDKNIPVALLIGRNCPMALSYTEVVPGTPCVLKTAFGPSISICTSEDADKCFKTMTISPGSAVLMSPEKATSVEKSPDPICQRLLDLFERDFRSCDPADLDSFSREERRFIEILENSTEKKDAGYEMDFPLEPNMPQMPPNRDLAVKQLHRIQARMAKDESYREDFIQNFKADLDANYIEPVPAEEPPPNPGELNYVMYHGVYHPKSKKFRKVYNVPMKCKGVSLETYLLTGPNLTAYLPGCLVRFRKERVAMSMDIKSMFCRVRLSEKHRNYVRLVWFAYNEDGSLDFNRIVDYRVTHHLFGASSSPSVACFALQKTADDNRDDFSVATYELIKKHFYVDDGCTSTYNVELAKALCAEVLELLERGGFEVHKFLSNDRDVLKSLDSKCLSKELQGVADLNHHTLPSTAILGIPWNPNNDVLKFDVHIPEKPLTRAGILSAYSTVFDPTGILSPLFLEARLISQELCHLGVDGDPMLEWHDPIPEELQRRWLTWTGKMAGLQGFSLPRSFIPMDFGVLVTAQLHHFGDASDVGYGCVSYLRVTDQLCKVHVSIVSGKTRVCPSDLSTLPRKEITSLKLAVEQALHLRRELMPNSYVCPYPEVEEFYYSDSMIALGMIENDKKALKLFFANRAAYIVQNTTKANWFHISGLRNPADFCSRGIEPASFTIEHPYVKGPEFLWMPEEDWRPLLVRCTDISVLGEYPEITKTCKATQGTSPIVTAISEIEPCPGLVTMIDRCSSLERARNRVRILMNFSENLKKKLTKTDFPGSSLAEKLETATFILLRTSQQVAFSTELASLQQTRSSETFLTVTSKSKTLNALAPFYDRDLRIIRVGGRLHQAETLSLVERHPIIVPGSLHISYLVIDFYHRKVHHAGYGITLTRIRQAGLWILNGTSQVKGVLEKCVICRRMRAGELNQKMADLPIERLSPGLFQVVGIDCFGPITVKVNRSTVKRYGLIFVCFASRSIHVEKLHDMSTERFLNGVRRFISRRGDVRQFWCDRGTNFVGAAAELTKAMDNLDDEKIKRELASKYGTEYYRFGHPFSSHKNGHIERQIRTVRSVLMNILKEHSLRLLDDDTLETFLLEAEGIVNSRPLSVTDLNDPSATPLSPINLLTQKSTVVGYHPGTFTPDDMILRNNFRKSQFLANAFWDEWKTKYLMDLQKRDKWFDMKRTIQVGDVVVMKETDLPRNQWPLARVTKVIVDPDGLVRKGTVKIGDKLYDRPISKMVMLIPKEEQCE